MQHFTTTMKVFVLSFVYLVAGTAFAQSNDEPQTIENAFAIAHDGYSVDEVIIRDDLRERFLDAAKAQGIQAPESELLLSLLKLRKSGKLNVKATRRGRKPDESVFPAAEIATRVVTDRHRVSTDFVLASPDFRKELQEEANKLMDGVTPYDLREQLDSDRIAHSPGVSLFRHSTEGYLYVGEAVDLSVRLRQHVTASDRAALAKALANKKEVNISIELHVFPAESPARKISVRRAYESELIRSRRPKFNVRP